MKALLAAMRRAEVLLTTTAFVVLIAVIFGDVVMRRVTGSGIVWARELGVFANIVLTIIGIGLASSDGTHLRPRVFDRLVPRDWDPAMTRIQEALTAIAFGTLAWIAYGVVQETIALDDRSIVLRWAVWPIQLCLPLAFAAGFVRHGIFALDPALRPGDRGEGDVP
ncbi:MAG: TRAP transporter small permease subunit [Steroidobacteraceae bacterium]